MLCCPSSSPGSSSRRTRQRDALPPRNKNVQSFNDSSELGNEIKKNCLAFTFDIPRVHPGSDIRTITVTENPCV